MTPKERPLTKQEIWARWKEFTDLEKPPSIDYPLDSPKVWDGERFKPFEKEVKS